MTLSRSIRRETGGRADVAVGPTGGIAGGAAMREALRSGKRDDAQNVNPPTIRGNRKARGPRIIPTMTTHYTTAVFDFDGTLADSFASAVAIFRRIGPGLGLKPIGDPELARAMPTRQFLKQIGATFWKLGRVVRAYQAAAAEGAHELKLFPDWPETLRALRARGVRLGILSSNREDAIRTCLRANGVEDLFAFVVGYPKLFGKAKALRRILKAEGIGRDALLYVGDETRDIEAAHKAKVAVAAVGWGFQAPSVLRDTEPTHFVETPGELLALLKGESGPQG